MPGRCLSQYIVVGVISQYKYRFHLVKQSKPILIKVYITALFVFLTGISAYAGHLIGGELSYECLSNNNYRINLTIYRNCLCETGSPRCADFDDQALVIIYDADGNHINDIRLELDLVTGREPVPPVTEGLCLNSIPEVCVERSTGYRGNINLPPREGGYTMSYMRCCRNGTILNINNPADVGSTYSAQIPDPGLAACNNSPTFTNYPPIIICAGFPLKFDHSATDADGDSLLYELCTPFDYPLSPSMPAINDEPFPEPPFDNIRWIGDFDVENQLGGSPKMTIDPATGLINAFPTIVGQFVVGICVSEFRDGELLSTGIRDFQFNVADCDVAVAGIESDDIDANGSFILNECGDFTVQFINESVGADIFRWDLGDPTPGATDTSTEFQPIYEYPDTGRYEVTLIAERSSDGLCSDTANIILNLYPKLVPDFEAKTECSIVPVEFTDITTSDYGEVVLWSWEFGDGGLSNDQNPVHLYEEGGNYTVILSVSTDLNCLEQVTKEIYVKPTPVSNYENSMLCIAQPVLFDDISDVNIGEIIEWNWQVYNILDTANVKEYNVKSPSHTFSDPGEYNVFLEVIGDEGCKAEIVRPVTIYEKLQPNAGMDEDICDNESVQLMVTANVPATFEWSPKDPAVIDDPTLENPVVSPNTTTTFTVLAEDPNGCQGESGVTVNVQPAPIVDAGETTSFCDGESIQLQGEGIDAGGNNATIEYIWSPDQFISNTSVANPVVDPPNDMVYILNVTEDVFGCNNTDSVLVKVVKPVVAAVTEDLIACELEIVQLMASGGDYYSWSPETGLSDPDIANPTVSLSETATYQVTVSNDCYEDIAEVTIEIQPAPQVDAGADFDIDIGDVIRLNGFVDTLSSDAVFSWYPPTDLLDAPTILRPEALPINDITYTLTATSDNGCSLSDSMNVKVAKIFNIWIPNAFSPNNDSKNDEIGLVTKGIKDLEIFRIYNRWGQKVYETNDITAKWDGNFNGQEQEIGVYVYYAIGNTFTNENFKVKGNITLIR